MRWRNVAMLGGVRGAISIALAAAIPTSLIVTSSDIDTINTMVLGVAFVSISLQAALLFRYISRKFTEEVAEQEKELNVKLMKVTSAIEKLDVLRGEGTLSDEEFSNQLENEKNKLEELLGEIKSQTKPTSVVRTRAASLYASMASLRARRQSKQNSAKKPEKVPPERSTSENGHENQKAD